MTGSRATRPRLPRVLSALLFLAVTAVGLGTWRDHGVSVDEMAGLANGQLLVNWYASGFSDRTPIEASDYRLYGGFSNLLSYLAVRVLPLPPFDASHLVTLAFGIMGLVATHDVAAALGGPWAGVLAALFLVALPEYAGHAVINPKDLPLAALMMLSVRATIASLEALAHAPERLPRVSCLLGVAIGLTNAVRTAGFLVLGLFALAAAVSMRAHRRTWRELAGALGLTSVVAWGVMLLFWPYAQTDPLWGPFRATLAATRFHNAVPSWFEGRYYLGDQLPRHYELKLLLMSLPEVLLAAIVLAVIGFALHWRATRPRAAELLRSPRVLGLGCTAAIPVLVFGLCYVMRPVNYDRLRHQLFALPPIAVVAAVGTALLLRRAGSRPLRGVLVAALGAGLVVPLADMAELHPYQYVYFNRLIGRGLEQGYRRYDHEYWATSLKEATEWVVSHRHCFPARTLSISGEVFEEGARSGKLLHPVAYYLVHAGAFEGRGLRYTEQANLADIVILRDRFNRGRPRPSPVAHTVGRLGIPMSYVYWMGPERLTCR